MIETIVFDVGETINRDDLYWASLGRLTEDSPHTMSALVTAVVAFFAH